MSGVRCGFREKTDRPVCTGWGSALRTGCRRSNGSVNVSRPLGSSPRVTDLQMVSTVVQFLKKEDGPTAVEYAVMLALIIVVCIAAITAIGTSANQTFSSVGSAIKPTAS